MKTNKRVNEKTPFSMGNTWSNWFVFSLIVKVVFPGCISYTKNKLHLHCLEKKLLMEESK